MEENFELSDLNAPDSQIIMYYIQMIKTNEILKWNENLFKCMLFLTQNKHQRDMYSMYYHLYKTS